MSAGATAAAQKPALLLSDLHLPARTSPLRDVFLRFIQGPARTSRAVYILGDLFEYWIGDEEGLIDYSAEARALSELTQTGVEVYFQHGNRDFLVGNRFFQATGVRPLADPEIVEFAGTRTILSHGDIYCTGDVGYQRWRRFSRNSRIQAAFGKLPYALRLRVAGAARTRSNEDKRNKADAIMDVDDAAIARTFREHAVALLIHGHTHRPATQAYGRQNLRIVLPDWRPDHTFYLRCEANAGPEHHEPVFRLEAIA